MADVLLTHSYHLYFDSKQVRKMQPYRPLGTLFAASALREHGLSVVLFDTMLRNPDDLADVLDETLPKILVIYEDDFNFLTKMCLSRMRDVVWKFIALAKRRQLPVIIHGSDASDNSELFLSQGADYLLLGEAEVTVTQLCKALLAGKSPDNISGLIQQASSGNILHPGQTLSTNPFWPRLSLPPNDLIDLASYRKAWNTVHGYFSVNMVASRGCPYRCNWCAKPISGDKFQLRPAADVAEEMRLLKSTAEAQHIWFSDDVFALSHQWIKEFAREVTSRHAALPFKVQSRANLMTTQVVGWLKEAGCEEVWMGVESGSQKILDAMDKGLSISQIEEARERLRHAGIRACYFLQFGYPGEGLNELQQTISLVRRTRPDGIGVSFSYPLPGTVFYERVQAQMGSKRNWVASDDLCVLFQAEYSTKFYRAVRDALHAEVDSWADSSQDVGHHVQLLWQEVRNLEALEHRNIHRKNEATGTHSVGFVSVEHLAGTAEA